MKNVVICIIYFLSHVIKKNKKLITLIYRGYSGSNLTPIIEKINKELKKYLVMVIYDGEIYNKFYKRDISKKGLYKHILKKYWYVFKSNLIITTHGMYRLRNNNKMINLSWFSSEIHESYEQIKKR